MTLSIAARSADGAFFGIAIASSSPAVAARCAHARAAAGAVATQNITDPSLGPAILERLAGGSGTAASLASALSMTPFADYRQLIVVGRAGPPAVHSGARALGVVAAAVGRDAAAAGNLLANRDVPAAMLAAFEGGAGGRADGIPADASSGGREFGDRLLRALGSGLEAGGEAGPVHSAGLLVVHRVSWPVVDLRVDWSLEDPVRDLATVWGIYRPQIDDYVQRALDPTRAPGFGVPGDP